MEDTDAASQKAGGGVKHNDSGLEERWRTLTLRVGRPEGG